MSLLSLQQALATIAANQSTPIIGVHPYPTYPDVGQGAVDPGFTNPETYAQFAMAQAIFDSGSNVNGKFIKFPNNILYQYGSLIIVSGTGWGGGPWSSTPFYRSYAIPFPLTFVSVDSISVTILEPATVSFSWPGYQNCTLTGISGYIFNAINNSGVSNVVNWQAW